MVKRLILGMAAAGSGFVVPATALACSMCKGSLDDPAASRLATGYALSVVGMLATLVGVFVVGGVRLARAVDPDAYQRARERLLALGGPRGRLALGAVLAVFVAGTVVTTRAARVEPPRALPVEVLAGRAVIRPAPIGSATAPRDSAAPRARLSSDTLTGRTVVVTFFATWCVPCRDQLRDIEAIGRDAGDRVAIVAVDIFESNPDLPAERHVHGDGTVHYHTPPPPSIAVAEWLAREGVGLTVVGATRDIVIAFGNVARIPSTFVFGPDGRLVRYFVNDPVGDFVRPDAATLRAVVEAGRPNE